MRIITEESGMGDIAENIDNSPRFVTNNNHSRVALNSDTFAQVSDFGLVQPEDEQSLTVAFGRSGRKSFRDAKKLTTRALQPMQSSRYREFMNSAGIKKMLSSGCNNAL